METTCKLQFHGASGNSCPHSLLWVEAPRSTPDGKADEDGVESTNSDSKLADTVIYASSGVINLATSHKSISSDCITSVSKTLVTRTLDHSAALTPSLQGGDNDDGNAVSAAAVSSAKRVLARGEAVEDAAAPRSITALSWFVVSNYTTSHEKLSAMDDADAYSHNEEAPPSPSNKHLVVLISEGNFNYTQAANQTNALHFLNDLSLSYRTIDGMDPSQREKRNQLFDISGIRGNYPQIFLCKDNTEGEGSLEYQFLGDYEWLESCNLDELNKMIVATEFRPPANENVINEVKSDGDNTGLNTSFGIASAFSDGTVTLWKWSNQEWVEHVLIGHDPNPIQRAKHHIHQVSFDAGNLQESIADISAVSLVGNATLVATASSKGIIIHLSNIVKQQQQKQEEVYSQQLSHHASASVLFVERSDDECYLFGGSASPRHNKVWVYTIPHFSPEDTASSSNCAWVTLPLVTVCEPISHGSLLGHQDWITCFSWLDNLSLESNDEGREGALLASSGHDAKIRLWKFSTRASSIKFDAIEEQENFGEVMRDDGDDEEEDKTTIEGDDEEDEANIDDLEGEEGEARLMIYHSGSSTAVSLEALLLGHPISILLV